MRRCAISLPCRRRLRTSRSHGKGNGEQEQGIDTKSGTTIVRINPKFYRPAEVDNLIGNADKGTPELGWEAKTSLEELCRIMVEEDLNRVANTHALF